ncbi:hypothetical protein MMB232_01796 [Brevundimonas subvibrioides]|uniref:DHHC zinc finger domain containing protein n=1 Tax=Brevundimonas subvibrioides (strain ATCC 15264 / DSM 4735 / LMG 14903 / NBRC 16000 / CB 81) TaxID=633149 RepID=D9QHK1_BRESC|nr:hypothetical protein [Brevundimonas subvibrioides]ADL01167.1 DHHC zinc finger domain containing protein [Brevundimonas subvibrioides ATCC 15264]
MTLFGTTLDGAQVASLVALLAILLLWIGALGRERGYARWFKAWEAERKARHDAEQGTQASDPDRPPTGPWG